MTDLDDIEVVPDGKQTIKEQEKKLERLNTTVEKVAPLAEAIPIESDGMDIS
jgi:hypothetical protein